LGRRGLALGVAVRARTSLQKMLPSSGVSVALKGHRDRTVP